MLKTHQADTVHTPDAGGVRGAAINFQTASSLLLLFAPQTYRPGGSIFTPQPRYFMPKNLNLTKQRVMQRAVITWRKSN